MNTFSPLDLIILFILITGIGIGIKRGVIKSAVMFFGTIIVLILSFLLKNPVAHILYSIFPFIELSGKYQGLTTLNILIFNAIAFIAVYLVLIGILQIIIKISGFLEKILDYTIILAIPSKILGGIFGLLENYLIVFVIMFIIVQIPNTYEFTSKSVIGNYILSSTPILSKTSKEYYDSAKEILSIVDTNNNGKTEEEINNNNKVALDIMLKHHITNVEEINYLVKIGKLKVKNINEVINKY